jgi:hypothetical protein
MSDEQVELNLTQKIKAFLISTGAAQTPGTELSGHEETHFCALVELRTGTPAHIVRDNVAIIEGFINSGIGAADPVEAPAVEAVVEEPKAATTPPEPPKEPVVDPVAGPVVDPVAGTPVASSEGAAE